MERTWRQEGLPKAQLCCSILVLQRPCLTSPLISFLLFFFFLETRVLARAAVCWDLLQYRVYRLGSVSGSCCCDTAFSNFFYTPREWVSWEKQKGSTGTAWSSFIKPNGLHGLWVLLKCFLQPQHFCANEENIAKGSGVDGEINTYFVPLCLFIMKDWKIRKRYLSRIWGKHQELNCSCKIDVFFVSSTN